MEVDIVEDRLVVEDLQIGVGGSTGQRVPSVGMAVIKSVQAILAAECRGHAIGAECDAHGHESAGDALGDAHNVGRDVGQIAGKHFSGAAKTSEDFIRNQQDVILGTERTDLLQKFDRVNDHAARALQ